MVNTPRNAFRNVFTMSPNTCQLCPKAKHQARSWREWGIALILNDANHWGMYLFLARRIDSPGRGRIPTAMRSPPVTAYAKAWLIFAWYKMCICPGARAREMPLCLGSSSFQIGPQRRGGGQGGENQADQRQRRQYQQRRRGDIGAGTWRLRGRYAEDQHRHIERQHQQ